jgi:hypothetical protein
VIATVFGVVAGTTPTCPSTGSNVCPSAFSPVPKSVLENGEIEFTPLAASMLSRVRISPQRAEHIADSQYGGAKSSRVVFESLGGYIDKDQIIPDWAGTTSYVPRALPSYIVRIHDDAIVTVDPSRSHFWNVIVNAANGKIVSAFSYE